MSAALLTLVRPAAAQDCSGVEPYVFVLFDTSGSLNWSPPCSAAEQTAGLCSYACSTYNCWAPQQGDDPDSKLYQQKQALFNVLDSASGIRFGFASFNQDELKVRAKHWTYQAAGSGVTIPGFGAYPATGQKETFGYPWSCDTGSGDHEIGCYSTTPADLPDSWERARVSVLPKLGTLFNQTTTFYVRSSSLVYRVRYIPPGSATPGSSVTVTVQVHRCTNPNCTTTVSVGQTNVTFNPVNEYLSWDLATSTPSRTDPEMSFFTASAATDSAATNTCSGWDPNTDSTVDDYSGYDLRWPTIADFRGTPLDLGDVIPLDWTADHRTDLQERLAPNRIGNPTASPDFQVSTYLRNLPVGSETFLRLKNEGQRPLIGFGSTPHGNSLASFAAWYPGWEAIASTEDPDWSCRRVALLVLTDGDETCEGQDACTEAADLLSNYGIKTYVAGFGLDATILGAGSKLECMADQGGTTSPYLSRTRPDLEDSLNAILADILSGP